MGRGEQLENWLLRGDPHHVILEEAACTLRRHRGSRCRRCVEVCPAGAVSLTPEREVRIDDARCTACGFCAVACPTGALSLGDDGQGIVRAARERLAHGQDLAFACTRHAGDRAGAVRVGCIGQLDPGVILSVVALGARRVVLVDSHCRSCPLSRGRDLAEAAVMLTRDLLREVGDEAEIALGDWLSSSPSPERRPQGPPGTVTGDGARAAQKAGASRRDLLRSALVLLAAGAAGAALPDLGGPHLDETLGARRVPVRRERLLQALRSVAARAAGGRASAARGATPLPRLVLGQPCIACGVCARFCPTGALGAEAQDGYLSLTFQAAACTGCALCLDACGTGALQIAPGAGLASLLSGDREVLGRVATSPTDDSALLREARERLFGPGN